MEERMISEMVALNEVELGAVSGGKLSSGEVCTTSITTVGVKGGELTLGWTTCTFGGKSITLPTGHWEPA
jgi:hypothetical protein